MLVGRVVQVSANASMVQLMIDRNFSVAGVLERLARDRQLCRARATRT